MSEPKKDTKTELLVENSEEQTYELSRILRFILVSSFILLISYYLILTIPNYFEQKPVKFDSLGVFLYKQKRTADHR